MLGDLPCTPVLSTLHADSISGKVRTGSPTFDSGTENLPRQLHARVFLGSLNLHYYELRGHNLIMIPQAIRLVLPRDPVEHHHG